MTQKERQWEGLSVTYQLVDWSSSWMALVCCQVVSFPPTLLKLGREKEMYKLAKGSWTGLNANINPKIAFTTFLCVLLCALNDCKWIFSCTDTTTSHVNHIPNCYERNEQTFTEALFRLCYCPPLRLILGRRDTVWCAGIEQPQAQFALVQRATLIDIRSRQIQCLCRSWRALCINVHNIGRHTYVIVYIRKYYLTHLQPISLNHNVYFYNLDRLIHRLLYVVYMDSALSVSCASLLW